MRCTISATVPPKQAPVVVEIAQRATTCGTPVETLREAIHAPLRHTEASPEKAQESQQGRGRAMEKELPSAAMICAMVPGLKP